jgi:hypothetical protein
MGTRDDCTCDGDCCRKRAHTHVFVYDSDSDTVSCRECGAMWCRCDTMPLGVALSLPCDDWRGHLNDLTDLAEFWDG